MIHFKREGYPFRDFGFVACAAICIGLTAGVSQGATLEHKWHAGEQLAYDMSLDGTMTIETDASAPILFAGIPLDVKVNGSANILVDTREVAPDGGATLALSFPQVKLRGTAWEQVATLDAKDGAVGLTFNGQNLGKNTPVPWLTDPAYALQVSKTAHVERIVPLKEEVVAEKKDDAGAEATAVPDAAGAGAGDAPPQNPKIGNNLPINVAGLMRSMALQLLPTLWPGHDVAPGETWSIESRLPVPTAKADATPALEMLSLGKFDLTLDNEEDYNGHRAYRVTMQGLLDLNKDKAVRLNNGQGTRLVSAVQKVNGTLWFDAVAGQLVGVEFRLTGNVAGIIAMPQRKPGDTPAPFSASEHFDGLFKLQLKSVTMKEAPLAALPN